MRVTRMDPRELPMLPMRIERKTLKWCKDVCQPLGSDWGVVMFVPRKGAVGCNVAACCGESKKSCTDGEKINYKQEMQRWCKGCYEGPWVERIQEVMERRNWQCEPGDTLEMQAEGDKPYTLCVPTGIDSWDGHASGMSAAKIMRHYRIKNILIGFAGYEHCQETCATEAQKTTAKGDWLTESCCEYECSYDVGFKTGSSWQYPGCINKDQLSARRAMHTIEGFLCGMNDDKRFRGTQESGKECGKEKEKLPQIDQICVCCPGCCPGKEAPAKCDPSCRELCTGDQCLDAVWMRAMATWEAGQLCGAPANYCNPDLLTGYAVDMAKKYDFFHKRFGKSILEDMGMGAALAVGQGSFYGPELFHATYTPKNADSNTPRVAFVGKCVCFDAGGLNIKSMASRIHDMKLDMGGTAAMLGAMAAIGESQPENVIVDFIFIAVENVISDRSYRPGDIITSAAGITIEVGNTDAEGRLTLCDAIHYACEQEPDCILDMATLTGACMVALGQQIGGLYANSPKWGALVQKSAALAGQKVWPMPLASDYTKCLESHYADTNNCDLSGRGGGSITAALFLEKFVKRGIHWAHMDIAAPVFDMNTHAGTGYGAKIFYQVAQMVSCCYKCKGTKSACATKQ